MCASLQCHWKQCIRRYTTILYKRLLCPPRTPMAAKKEIIFFILIKLSIKHHNFKIFLAQSKYVHCKSHTVSQRVKSSEIVFVDNSKINNKASNSPRWRLLLGSKQSNELDKLVKLINGALLALKQLNCCLIWNKRRLNGSYQALHVKTLFIYHKIIGTKFRTSIVMRQNCYLHKTIVKIFNTKCYSNWCLEKCITVLPRIEAFVLISLLIPGI